MTSCYSRPGLAQLRNYLREEEHDPECRKRLFERFGGPRAVFVKRLTDSVLRFVLSEWEELRGCTVLDYGCGVMPYRKAFELAGAIVIGADIGKNDRADLLIPTNGKLPLQDNSCDYVVSFQVLEHVLVPQAYLTETCRVLKPCGKLFITTHGLWPYHPTPTDYYRWTREGLRLELERAGFSVGFEGYMLNDYSAAIQHLVMSAEYRGRLRRMGWFVHFLAHCVISASEKFSRHEPHLPSGISVVATKL